MFGCSQIDVSIYVDFFFSIFINFTIFAFYIIVCRLLYVVYTLKVDVVYLTPSPVCVPYPLKSGKQKIFTWILHAIYSLDVYPIYTPSRKTTQWMKVIQNASNDEILSSCKI